MGDGNDSARKRQGGGSRVGDVEGCLLFGERYPAVGETTRHLRRLLMDDVFPQLLWDEYVTRIHQAGERDQRSATRDHRGRRGDQARPHPTE